MEAGKGRGGPRVPQRKHLTQPPGRAGRWWKGYRRTHHSPQMRASSAVTPPQGLSGGGTETSEGRSPATTLRCRHQASPAPAGNSQDNTHRPIPTPTPQACTQQALNNEHLHVLLCWLSLNGARLSVISQHWMGSGRHTRGEEMACDDHLLRQE